jgi:hypothetical protein
MAWGSASLPAGPIAVRGVMALAMRMSVVRAARRKVAGMNLQTETLVRLTGIDTGRFAPAAEPPMRKP